MPEAIVLGPLLYLELQVPALSYLWCNPERNALFDVPIVIDAGAEGWEVKLR